MDKIGKSDISGLTPTQIAWVVQDVEKSKAFFQDMLGVTNFSPTVTTRLKDYDGTYYGEPSEAENFVTMTYSGGIFIEVIQPISGKSIFKDYIDKNPTGGVQHFAYSTPIANLDKVISVFEDKGYQVVSSFDTPIAKIVFFDTREEIGVFTEIMGITKQGEKAVQEMKFKPGPSPFSQTFFHGTKADLKIGDFIEVGLNSNYGQKKSAKFIYLTATLDAAVWGAELALGDGRERIYLVEPTGEIEDDPNLTDKKFPGNPTMSYRSKHPFKVVGEITLWQSHSPDQVKVMKEGLAKLKAQGIEAIED